MKTAYTGDLHLEFLASNLQEKFNREFSVKDLAEMFCNELAKIECDFAVVAGDTSHCPADVVRFFAEVDIRATKPIYVVLGNHDYWNWASSLVRNKYEDLPHKNVEAIEKWFKDKFRWGFGYDDFDDGSENRYYIFGHVHDIDTRTCSGVEIVKKDNFYGDAANGYRKSVIEFKVAMLRFDFYMDITSPF